MINIRPDPRIADGRLRYNLHLWPDGQVRMTLTIRDATRADAEALYAVMAGLTREQQAQVSIVFEGHMAEAEAVGIALGLTEGGS